MFRNMKLSVKLIIAFLLVGVLPFAVLGTVSLLTSSRALSDQAFSQLESMREAKKTQIERLLANNKNGMASILETVANLKQAAFEKLAVVQELKKGEIENYFKDCMADVLVLANNSQVIEGLQKFATAFKYDSQKTGNMWEHVAEIYGNGFAQYIDQYGYSDLYLISKDGDILYTAGRGDDLTKNLITGDLKDSALAKVFEEAKNGPAIQDFRPYAPADNQFMAFIAAPISQYERVIGVAVLRLSPQKLNSIAQKREGMGKSGETFLVGELDGLTAFRSEMLTMGDGQYVVGRPIMADYVELAVKGESGTGIFVDDWGKSILVAYNPLNIPGLKWASISKIDLEEIIAPKLEGEEDDLFAKYIKDQGYLDLYLIKPDGGVFYTVNHKADYGTNMVYGEYSESVLGALVKKVMESKQYAVSDFAPYEPSDNAPSAFLAQPVVGQGENVELVVAVQLSHESINDIMRQRQGLGATGETYVVGTDKLMRSDSFVDPENRSVRASFANPAKGSVDTEAVRAALSGASGEKIITGYKGKPVLAAFAPVDLGGATWALIAEIDEEEAFATVKRMQWLVGAIAVIGIAAIIAIALLVTRSITKPINRVIGGLTEGAQKVSAASGEVSSASQVLAEGSSEQAASIEETSSSLEEMSSMTRQNADNANEANSLMRESKAVVDQANRAMEELTTSMQEISSASEETSKIIKTIDEIAFQTNLLALNAAVEAARAGEAGAGFAVVADEVRNLAMRAAEAAKDTANLIEGTVKKVGTGTELLKKANQAFSGVAESSAKVGDLVSEIAAASSEQAQGIDQVNRAVTEMDRVTQQNASSAEESAAASEELSGQAEQMKSYVLDLAAIVGGNATNGSGLKTLDYTKSAKNHAPARPKLPQPEKTKKSVSLSKTHKEVTPEEKIPLEEDEFKDF